jgi:hypothetical protein
VNQVVAAIDRVTDGGLHTLGLKPWLTVHIVDVSMGAEEGVVTTNLVEGNPEVIGGLTVEAWGVGSSERMASVTELEDHGHGTLDLLPHGTVITSPVCTKLLRAKEEASRQNKGTTSLIVSLEKTTEGRSLVETSIGVMDLLVEHLGTVSLHVDRVEVNGVGVGAEDSGLVHIIPERVKVVRALESVVIEETSPELLSVLVKEVDPGGVSGPAVAEPGGRVALSGSDEDA